MGRQRRKTTKLTQHLLDDLGIQASTSGKGSGRVRLEARKKDRKAARIQKRVRDLPLKAAQSPTRISSSKDYTRPPASAHSAILPEKPEPSKSILKCAKAKTTDETKSARNVASYPSPPPSRKPSKGITDRLAADDAEIAALEKALGLKGKQKLPKSFGDDGLDVLLEGLSQTSSGENSAEPKRKRSDGEEWLRTKRLKATRSDHEPVPNFEERNITNGGEADEIDNDPSDDDVHSEHDFSGKDSFEDFASEVPSPAPQARVRENPYIAPAVAPGSTPPTSKYIPPSKRHQEEGSTGETSRLRRQMQGLLNRLSEANLLFILKGFEGLYRTHSRQDVTSTLVDLLMGLLCDPTSLEDTFVILHTGFIAALYKVIGSDFGAQTISRIDDEFAALYQARAQEEGNGKKLNNLINLLAQLYNFKVIRSTLLYDYIRLFIEDLSELNAELLLKIMRNSGPKLRKEDATSLKAINQRLHSAVAKAGPEHVSVRTNFMLETINDLANKGLKTGKAEHLVNAEHSSRMRITLGSLNERGIRASDPLNLNLKDLRETDRRGKWWIVGASYRDGDQLRDNSNVTRTSLSSQQDGPQLEANYGDNVDLLQLARQLGLNTDIRRSIFVTLMSGEDFETACDKLRRLPLKASQRSEIPRVLVSCAGAEEQYNPYYTLIARRLISREPKLKRAFQYSLWNLFEKIRQEGTDSEEAEHLAGGESLELRVLINHAKLFGSLIAEDGLAIGVLRDLNFAYLPEKLEQFAEILLITIILRSQAAAETGRNEKSLMEIFLKVKDAPDMVHGLRYFLKKIVSKTDVAGTRERQATVRWGCKVVRDALNAIPVPTVAE